MSAIHDISLPKAENPKARYFEEVGDICINADGILRLMDEIGSGNDLVKTIRHITRMYQRGVQ